MFRETITPRPDWVARVESVGFTYHSLGQTPGEVEGVYWDEGTCYRFSLAEVETIEAATEELHRICLEAVDVITKTPALLDRFGLSPDYRSYVIRSWDRRDPYVAGRMDLAFDPKSGAVKLLEYNADTPTLIIETAVVQWHWLEDQFPNEDQFNSLHERLIERYREIGKLIPKDTVLHFSSLLASPAQQYGHEIYSAEEYQHAVYGQDLAQQAGIRTKFCAIPNICQDVDGNLVDDDGDVISYWSKLYPWEWLAQEMFGAALPQDRIATLEPVWKMLLSHKAILPILWQLFPDHPNLLPAFFEEDKADLVATGNYVAKPVLAREGANITVVTPGKADVVTQGSYGANAMIYQGRANLPEFDGHHVVIGSWVVGENAAGMILREADSVVVVNTSKVVPHYFKD